MNILAIIPARSGSKSVKDKNIRLVNGKPMLAYSIEHALASKLINRVILSTDSEEYAAIGRSFGAETPFIRPAEYATDTSLDIDVFAHCLSWLEEHEGYRPELVVQLRPTYPIRDIEDIDGMIRMLQNAPEADSVRSLAPAKEVAYKMWHMDEAGAITPIMKDIPECYNMPRQQLPKVYYQNACIDVVRGSCIRDRHSMSGGNILGYVMKHNYDIDDERELQAAEKKLELQSCLTEGGRRFVFDIDGVIAKLQKENNYALSEPDTAMIKLVNRLYNAGNTIILHTARGYATGLDWGAVTQAQLLGWGVRYHELHFGKPNADYYIDDKQLDLELLIREC